jgi:D-glycero-D-manno-heptose 1,7-bisphosphate phosphatase
MPEGRPAVFLDRDGTVIVEREYLSDPEGVILVAGAVESLGALREAGLVIVIVTNQSGIARGLYSEADYHAVAARLEEILTAEGVPVDATYFCPHHPDFTGPCACRKPSVGMYLQAALDLGLDLGSSFYVGDRLKDVEPAVELGGRGILVRTGYGAEEEAGLPEGSWVSDDLPGAAALIVKVLEDAPQGDVRDD